MTDNIAYSSQTAGIAIEHGQSNTIEDNLFANGDTYGILIYTDLRQHFPNSSYSCLNIPNQQVSSNYTITGNLLIGNAYSNLAYFNTTDSLFYNNYIDDDNGRSKMTAFDSGLNQGNMWNVTMFQGINVIGDSYVGGNYWSDYNFSGNHDVNCSQAAYGFGCIPYDGNGRISNGGDQLPLIPTADDSDGLRQRWFEQWQYKKNRRYTQI